MIVRGTWKRSATDCAPSSRTRSDGFLIHNAPAACRECWGCVRACPARAIRMVNGHAEVIEERCVKCGQCVSECGVGGNSVRDDTPHVRQLLESDQPVVAILASEFVAAMHPMSPCEVESALEAIGFFAVESVVLGEEIVATEYERSFARPCASLMLRSTCPVTVDWVRKYYPQLVPALLPIVPPYVAQARLVKELYPSGTAVVYVSPCYARKDEAYDPQFEGAVDGAIDFVELEHLIEESKAKSPFTETRVGQRRPQPVKELSLTDGFPRAELTRRNQTDAGIVKVRGLRELDELLRAILCGEAAPHVIDMLSCEGCIDGPAVRPGLSVFAKRNIDAAERIRAPHAGVASLDLMSFLPTVGLVRSFDSEPVVSSDLSDEQIDAILADGDFETRADALDCGVCGYDTCVEHAVAIFDNNSTWDMCFPLQKVRMQQTQEALEESATKDALTMLGNRRSFDERLADEISRTQRYGKPVSLLMVDVDGFKSINDRCGHPVGDEVLRCVGTLIRECVRASDITTRYGGDEFAVILPETDKTRAYAVAEKLRMAVADLTYDSADECEPLCVHVSIGVAAAMGKEADGVSLLEAADHALYEAKQSGRNQVRLAVG